MIIFIAGASGYLGSQLVRYFSKKCQCVALVRKSSSLSRLNNTEADIVKIDDGDSLECAFEMYRPDFVINTIALYGRNNEQLSDLVEANISVPLELYALSSKYACKAFFHTGTSLPRTVSPYANTKNTFVELVRSVHKSEMKFIDIALEHFYGPNDDHGKFTTYVVTSCLKNHDLNLTSGLQERDFIYIDDVVSAYSTLIENIDTLHHSEVIPIGYGSAPTIKQFVETVHKITLSSSVLNFGVIPIRENELMYSCADTIRLEKLGWQPEYSLEEGITKLIADS